MSKPVIKALPELIEAGIISSEKAEAIKEFYQQKPDKSGSRALIIFGILGALLVGLGIILIIAHNWDQLSKTVKLVFAFLPLIGGQIACAYALLQRWEEKVWREGAATFLFLSIGACISMISQIYNIPGQVSDLMFVWMLLGLPIIYILKSSVASFIYIVGITYYAGLVGYSERPLEIPYWYWLMLLLVLPHYFFLNVKKPKSNFTIFHHWMLPLSMIIILGTFGQREEMLMFLAYFSLFGWLYLIGRHTYFEDQRLRNNGFLVLGSVGSIIMLLSLSFDFFWVELYIQRADVSKWLGSPELIVSIVLTILALLFLALLIRRRPEDLPGLMDFLFLIFLFIFFLGFSAPGQSLIAINLLLFILGLFYIRRGLQKDHLGILNYGLIIITALIVCRFFDTKFSFILRGVLFVLVGLGFFIANYQMLRKRKASEKL